MLDHPLLSHVDLLEVNEESPIATPKVATYERLYGAWLQNILLKTNLEYFSGYNFAGPRLPVQGQAGSPNPMLN